MSALPPRTVEVYTAIVQYIARHHMAPTIRELGPLVGIRSTSAISRHLDKLRLAGRITWSPNRSRTIRLTSGEVGA